METTVQEKEQRQADGMALYDSVREKHAAKIEKAIKAANKKFELDTKGAALVRDATIAIAFGMQAEALSTVVKKYKLEKRYFSGEYRGRTSRGVQYQEWEGEGYTEQEACNEAIAVEQEDRREYEGF